MKMDSGARVCCSVVFGVNLASAFGQPVAQPLSEAVYSSKQINPEAASPCCTVQFKVPWRECHIFLFLCSACTVAQ